MTILPYPDKPLFLCYHNKAFPFGILQANCPEDITKWACTKCANCFYDPNSPNNKFNLDVWDVWGFVEGITTQQILQIQKDCFGPFHMDLLQILKGAIRSGCYVYGSYNERYIPNKQAYQKKNYMHDFLLIGCDDEKFISVGYVTDGSFQKYEIPNQNLMDGLYGTSGIKINLGFYRYKTGVVPIPDTKRLIETCKNIFPAQRMLTAHLRVATQSVYLPMSD